MMPPVLIKRACGGWLAVSPDDSPLRLGVEGVTAEDAEAAYARAWRQWQHLLAADDKASL